MKVINRHQQKGLSGIGWLVVLGFLGLIIITFLNVFPMYYENMQIKAALKGVQEDPSIDVKSKSALWTSLEKRLYIDGVTSIKREHVKMSRKDGKTTITVSYESRKPYIANLSIVGAFNDIVVIDR